LFLVEIEREREIMPAVGPSTRLHANDRLLFAGVVDGMVDLRKIRGLVPDTDQIDKLEGRPERRLVEAVVGAQSTLAGKSVRETEFRTVYNAAIIAVHRRGQRIRSKVGDIVLQPGDVLLLETQPTFATLHQHDPNFALLSEVRGSKPPKHDKAWIATLILLAMVTTNAAGLIPLSVAALLASGAMLLTRCLTGEEARRALELRVLLTIGAALGLGTALEQTGAASVVGDAIVSLSARFGPVAVLIGIYGATAVLAGIITTAAAAAIMFPVAAAAASAVAVDLKPVSYIVMIAASMAFSTPIGYQTNLMVYGPGGYRFADFLRLGLPLQIMLGVVVIALASWLWM
jgi:di/tricarboxylate transporter